LVECANMVTVSLNVGWYWYATVSWPSAGTLVNIGSQLWVTVRVKLRYALSRPSALTDLRLTEYVPASDIPGVPTRSSPASDRNGASVTRVSVDVSFLEASKL